MTMVAAAVLIWATVRGGDKERSESGVPRGALQNESPLLPAHSLRSWLNQQSDYVEVPVARYEGGNAYRLGADPDALTVKLLDSTSVGTVAYGQQCAHEPPCFYLVVGLWRDGELDVKKVVRPLTRDEALQIKTARYAKSP